MKNNKILILNYEFPPLGGGAGNANYYLLKEFSKIKNLEIDLVTSSTNKYKIKKFSKNITIHFLDIGKKGDLHSQSNRDLLKYSYKAYQYSKKLMKEKKFDLCHAFFGIPCGYIAMKLKIPYIVSLRGSDVPGHNPKYKFLDTLFFRRLSKKIWNNAIEVISLSQDLTKRAKKSSKNQKFSIIPCGINTMEFCPKKSILKKQKTFNILFVGRLNKIKGVNYLLNSFKTLNEKYSNIRLIIVGEGLLEENYKTYVKKNKLQNKIIFLGRIPHRKLPKIYQKSHIFVLPSINEALGNVVQEAMASGLPIITTKTGASELIKDNGIIVKKKSSKEITKALKKYLDNKNLIKIQGKISRKLSKKMSWKNEAKKYLEIYRR